MRLCRFFLFLILFQGGFDHTLNEALSQSLDIDELPYLDSFKEKASPDQRATCTANQIENILRDQIQYPVQAKEDGIQGTVICKFRVNTEGIVDSVVIVRGIGGGCEEELARVLKTIKNFTPAKRNNEFVAYYFIQKFRFLLEEEEYSSLRILWGNLEDDQIPVSSLRFLSNSPVSLMDNFGNKIEIAEVEWYFGKNQNKLKPIIIPNGELTKKVQRNLRRLKPGNIFWVRIKSIKPGKSGVAAREYQITPE
jgi:TonB family protein